MFDHEPDPQSPEMFEIATDPGRFLVWLPDASGIEDDSPGVYDWHQGVGFDVSRLFAKAARCHMNTCTRYTGGVLYSHEG